MFLAIIAALIVSASGHDASSRDVWDDAEIYLQDFISTVQTAIDEFSANFDQLEQVVAYVASEAIRNAEDDLASMSQSFDYAVEEIRTRATDQNRDSIEECINSYEDQMTKVPSYVRDLIYECVNGMQDSTASDVRLARAQAHDHLEIADQLRAEIDGCHVAQNQDECISRVVIEILLQTLEAPTQIQELFRKTEDSIGYYIRSIPTCTTDRINGVATIVNTVLRYINTCVDAIFNFI